MSIIHRINNNWLSLLATLMLVDAAQSTLSLEK
jgi:hypothetical protein